MAKPHWNYRVVRDAGTFSFREVYYDERGDVIGMTEQEAAPFGETISELVNDLHKMFQACALPILEIPKVENKS